MTTFATQLDTILHDRLMTSYALAKAMRKRGMKTAPILIDKYRQGDVIPSFENVILIAEILGVPITFFTDKE